MSVPGQPSRQYFATQGPLPSTVADFWRMVWEKNIKNIVMLTSETEKKVAKCHRYWPSESNRTLISDKLTVELIDEQKKKTEVIRKLQISSSEVCLYSLGYFYHFSCFHHNQITSHFNFQVHFHGR